MIKMLAMAVWAAVLAVLASSAAMQWQASRAAPHKAESVHEAYEFRKTKVINVPVVADGALQGYVIVQFTYSIDAKGAEKLNVSPDAFILDYAFRTLYGDPDLDFRHLEKYNMTALTSQLKTVLNERLGEGMVKDVLLQDFSYMPKDQAPR